MADKEAEPMVIDGWGHSHELRYWDGGNTPLHDSYQEAVLSTIQRLKNSLVEETDDAIRASYARQAERQIAERHRILAELEAEVWQ